MRAPEFWDRRDSLSRLAIATLAPIGLLYGATLRWKARNARPYHAAVPVICVGNITAGGSGKTPIALAIADAIIARGGNPYFLTRGYGGRLSGPIVVGKEHTALDVGDEPLILSGRAATVVSRDRRVGAALAVQRGADFIVMDDGFQNFSITKDLSIVVVDGEAGFGNGHVLPAGPLREPVGEGLKRADVVIVMGPGSPSLAGYSGPLLRAITMPVSSGDWSGRRVVAFAGIGRPAKFFCSLQAQGTEVVEMVAFPDHHAYGVGEIAELKRKARDQNAQLVTTEKDYVRLEVSQREGIAMLPIRTVIEPPGALERLLDSLAAPR
jgi:tetraacyldisaccharide 4'-kinase